MRGFVLTQRFVLNLLRLFNTNGLCGTSTMHLIFLKTNFALANGAPSVNLLGSTRTIAILLQQFY